MASVRLDRPVDYSLYLIIHRQFLQGRDLIEEVLKAVRGGVTMVQLREKAATSREFYQLALSLKQALGPDNIPLIINDRLDIALAAGADGLHLGQADLPAKVARSLLGTEKILGLTARTPEQLAHGQRQGVDYFGVGPAFTTQTKADASEPMGIAGLKNLRQLTGLPIVAIGGIDLTNVAAVKAAKVDGVAVASALLKAARIEEAAQNFCHLWRKM